MPKPSPKSAIELAQPYALSPVILADWWELIHRGVKYPRAYIHGAALAGTPEVNCELRFLYDLCDTLWEQEN